MVTIQQPRPLDEALGSTLVKQVAEASHKAGKTTLDALVEKTLGDGYVVESSRYFSVPADVAWIAISKNVQNQMHEHSVARGHYDKEQPGITLLDFYPQPHGAFVLATDKGSGRQGDRLIGYYSLRRK